MIWDISDILVKMWVITYQQVEWQLSSCQLPTVIVGKLS